MGFPNYSGIPPLSNLNPTANQWAATATLAAPLINNLLDKLKPKWGIFDKTGKVQKLTPDAFLSIEYKNEQNVPMYPQEDGAFTSYNKVSTPYVANVKVVKSSILEAGGSSSDLNGFLTTLESMANDTETYSIVTPDFTYLDANLKGFTYKRDSENGYASVVAMLNFVQIMKAQVSKNSANNPTTVAPSASDNANASANAPVNLGAVSPQAVTSNPINTSIGVR